MVSSILFLIFLTGLYPIWRAVRFNWKTTLRYPLFWGLGAWLAWVTVAYLQAIRLEPEASSPRYLALGLTGCASIAVLGARRPGVGAWNFVILALLLVMAFLWVEGHLAADDRILYRVRTVLLASTVAIGVLNYLPTRLAPAAVLLAFGCGLEIFNLTRAKPPGWGYEPAQSFARLIVALVPWVAYARMRWPVNVPSEFDQLWLRFRNSFGLFWAQRLREQFNQSAKHSDWPVVLRWQGLRLAQGAPPPSPADRQAMLENLRALMKRFGMVQEVGSENSTKKN